MFGVSRVVRAAPSVLAAPIVPIARAGTGSTHSLARSTVLATRWPEANHDRQISTSSRHTRPSPQVSVWGMSPLSMRFPVVQQVPVVPCRTFFDWFRSKPVEVKLLEIKPLEVRAAPGTTLTITTASVEQGRKKFWDEGRKWMWQYLGLTIGGGVVAYLVQERVTKRSEMLKTLAGIDEYVDSHRTKAQAALDDIDDVESSPAFAIYTIFSPKEIAKYQERNKQLLAHLKETELLLGKLETIESRLKGALIPWFMDEVKIQQRSLIVSLKKLRDDLEVAHFINRAFMHFKLKRFDLAIAETDYVIDKYKLTAEFSRDEMQTVAVLPNQDGDGVELVWLTKAEESGKFWMVEVESDQLLEELERLDPAEILFPNNVPSNVASAMLGKYKERAKLLESWRSSEDGTTNTLLKYCADRGMLPPRIVGARQVADIETSLWDKQLQKMTLPEQTLFIKCVTQAYLIKGKALYGKAIYFKDFKLLEFLDDFNTLVRLSVAVPEHLCYVLPNIYYYRGYILNELQADPVHAIEDYINANRRHNDPHTIDGLGQGLYVWAKDIRKKLMKPEADHEKIRREILEECEDVVAHLGLDIVKEDISQWPVKVMEIALAKYNQAILQKHAVIKKGHPSLLTHRGWLLLEIAGWDEYEDKKIALLEEASKDFNLAITDNLDPYYPLARAGRAIALHRLDKAKKTEKNKEQIKEDLQIVTDFFDALPVRGKHMVPSLIELQEQIDDIRSKEAFADRTVLSIRPARNTAQRAQEQTVTPEPAK